MWSGVAKYGVTLMFVQFKKSCFLFVHSVLCLIVRQVGGWKHQKRDIVQRSSC